MSSPQTQTLAVQEPLGAPARLKVNSICSLPTTLSVSGDCQGDYRSEVSPLTPHASSSSAATPKFLYPGSFPTSAANSPSLPVSPTHDKTSAPLLLSTAPEDHYSLLDTRKELPHSPPSLKSPKSFAHSRQNRTTTEEVPRQTLLKALVSGRPSLSPLSLTPMSIAPGLRQSIMTAAAQNSPRYIISQNGTEHHNNTGLNEYAIEASAAMLSPTSRSSAGLEPLKSPCFYHQRFDKTVNVDRVLEEIAGDEYRSHSRLMQTALGVREVARQLQRRTCKVAVKNVMIVTKARDNELVTLTRELAHWLMKTPRYGRRLGVNVYVDKKLRNSARFNAEGLLKEEPEFKKMLKYWTPDLCWSSPESFDLVLTLGGDGTVLFTSWLFQRIVPPVLSFSLGSLGFLTNFKYDLYRETLDKVLDDGLRVNMRMRFTCTVYRDEDGETVEKDQFEVLNELVIDRGPSPYVSQLELYGDNDLLTVVQADGCIFSTPTGSTAYSLSAGGSLVHPDIPAILLTPICPHSLSFRPMLLNDSMLLRVSVPKGSRATAWCAFDGKGRLELCPGDFVSIAASQYPFPTVLSNSTEWIDSISRTLRWNTRGAQQKPWNSVDKTEPEVWDIDTDSGVYNSDDEESGGDSPVGRKMALLGLA